ncbi:MAG: alpha/beta hydrolase [Chitinophagaceae bacterium]
MNQKLLSYKESQINYYCFGSGPKPVICFHGFGEDASTFAFLEKHTGNQFSFYCIDLPFHGKTEWKKVLNFTTEDLQQIVEKIISASNHTSQIIDHKFSLIGFSLGGRVALSFFQANPEKIEKLVLLAPDGLKVNFWYWLATQTWSGNRFFLLTMKKPAWFFGFLKLLNKLKLVNASIFKFVNYYIGDAKIRILLYNRWTTLRRLKPDLLLIKAIIKKENIPVRLIYGKHDRIILSSVGEKFKRGTEEQCTLTILPTGHQVLNEKYGAELAQCLGV